MKVWTSNAEGLGDGGGGGVGAETKWEGGSWLARRSRRRKRKKKKKEEEEEEQEEQEEEKKKKKKKKKNGDANKSGDQEEEEWGEGDPMSSLLPQPPNRQSSHRQGRSISSFAHDLEMTGHTGSLLWMAPEILNQWLTSERGAAMEKAKYSMAADVYSMGIVLYELVTRRLPWGNVRGPLTTNIGERVTQGKRPAFTEGDRLAMERDPEAKLLASLMTKCWAGDAKKRPQFSQILWHLGGARKDNESFSSAASGVVVVVREGEGPGGKGSGPGQLN